MSDFVQESALALYKTVLLCVSALSLGLLPGKGLGNTWPPFQAQVSVLTREGQYNINSISWSVTSPEVGQGLSLDRRI